MIDFIHHGEKAEKFAKMAPTFARIDSNITIIEQENNKTSETAMEFETFFQQTGVTIARIEDCVREPSQGEK